MGRQFWTAASALALTIGLVADATAQEEATAQPASDEAVQDATPTPPTTLAEPGASAQPAAAPPPTPDAGSVQKVEPAIAAPAPTPMAPPLEAGGGADANCVFEQHGSIGEEDAETAAMLVCAALQEAGANVSRRAQLAEQVDARAPAYRTVLRTLGQTVIMSVTQEQPLGTPKASRDLRLNGIEETPKGAQRIAESLTQGVPLEKTASVDGLVGDETHYYQKRYGEFLIGLGVFGLMIPGADVYTGYGATIRGYYETPEFAIGLGFRVGGNSADDNDAYLVGVDVGGRYFFSDGDFSPFVGAGLGILWLGAEARSDIEWSGNGLTPSFELGVEFLRLHSSRLDIVLRADVPLFKLKAEDYGYDGYEYYGDRGGASTLKDRYALPIALAVAYSF